MIIDRLDFGGAERITMTLADTFLNNGHQITIITIDPIINIDVDERVNLHTLHFEKRFNKYTYNRKKMYQLLDTIQKNSSPFDLILVHLYLSSRIMKKYNHPFCYHVVHSTQSFSALKNKKGFSRLVAKYKIQRVYNNLKLICVSNGVKDDLLEEMSIKPASIEVIYNPFNIEEIRLKSRLKASLPSSPYIIFVGRLVKEKRVDYLLQAFCKSAISQKLLILGDGEEKEYLETLCNELKISDKVIFHPAVKNPYPYINNADFLILSSLYEGLPTVLIEALILQTPVLSTNCPSGPYEIMKFYTMDALVYDNYNIDDLTNKMKVWSRSRPDVAENSMQSFDVQLICKCYLELTKR